MQENSQLLRESLDRSWKQFSISWKKAKRKCSERQIHSLRIAIRKMVSLLSLLQASCDSTAASYARREFKKVLKRLGLLRDLQVQFLNLRHLEDGKALKGFRLFLKNQTRNEISPVATMLGSKEKERLRRCLKKAAGELGKHVRVTPEPDVRRALVEQVSARHDRFVAIRTRLVPGNEQSLHEMRLALKKLRYAVEGAASVIGAFSPGQLRRLRVLQKKLGNLRDLKLLESSIEQWSADQRREVQKALEPVCARLKRQYASEAKSLPADPQLKANLLPVRLRKPAVHRASSAFRERTIATHARDHLRKRTARKRTQKTRE